MTSFGERRVSGVQTLRKRIFLGYGATLLLIAVVLGGAMVFILELGRASDALLQEDYLSILAAVHMMDALERQDATLLLALMESAKQDPVKFKEDEARFLQWLVRAKDGIDLPGEGELIDSIEKNYVKYLTAAANLLHTNETEKASVLRAYRESVSPIFTVIREALLKVKEMNHNAIDSASHRVHGLVRHGILAISLIGSVSIMLGTIFSLFLSRVISQPVAELKEAVAQIAQGDYAVQVPVRGKDELALLASQFNLMAEKLRQYHAMNVSQIISEKQKGEAIIQSVDNGLVVADSNLLISDINPKAASIFGVKKDEVPGRHILEIVRDENLAKLLRQSVAPEGGPKVTEGENILTVMSEGKQLHAQFSIIPIDTPDQVVPGIMLLLHDVTRLHELDRLKSEFVLTASHELRTPLTGIGMAINMLLEKASPNLTEEEKKLLQACYGEVRRLSALVKDLLDLSKIEAGKLEMAFEPVAPSFLGDQAWASVKNQAEAKHIESAMEIPGNLPPVQADPAKIVWVLVNLLANAIRHSPEGSRIDLKAERAGGQIHFSVRDDGEGVPYEDQSRIFDKFVQVSGRDGSEGTGLGLAICREIVRAHQGTIWLDSHPGEGSTFTFTLPLAQA